MKKKAPVAKPTEAELRSAARILGHLGGLKGGKARAAKLSASRRKEIGRAAIAARWAKHRKLQA